MSLYVILQSGNVIKQSSNNKKKKNCIKIILSNADEILLPFRIEHNANKLWIPHNLTYNINQVRNVLQGNH